jgi:predicted TIM-barrel fold metal-dependent hydrolase
MSPTVAMPIVANHAHLMPAGSWREGDVSLLLRHLDACGIERAVTFAPFAQQMEADRRRANTWLLKQLAGEERLIPFGCLAPAAPDAGEVMHLLIEEGVRGAKVHPSIDAYDLLDPAAMDFYGRAEEAGFVLDFHTGPHGTRLAWSDPVKFDSIAWEFPRLTMVFEHMGGRTWFETFLAILSNHPRLSGKETLFAGLASVLSKKTHPLWYLGIERVLDLVEMVGARSLIYGLDFPWNTVETNRRDIALIQGLELPQEDKANILGGALLSLLSQGATT